MTIEDSTSQFEQIGHGRIEDVFTLGPTQCEDALSLGHHRPVGSTNRYEWIVMPETRFNETPRPDLCLSKHDFCNVNHWKYSPLGWLRSNPLLMEILQSMHLLSSDHPWSIRLPTLYAEIRIISENLSCNNGRCGCLRDLSWWLQILSIVYISM